MQPTCNLVKPFSCQDIEFAFMLILSSFYPVFYIFTCNQATEMYYSQPDTQFILIFSLLHLNNQQRERNYLHD